MSEGRTPPFVYRKRTREEFEQHRRRQELRKLAPRVRRNDERAKARAAELLRAEGMHEFAELIEDARWPKRGAPSLNPFEEAKQYLVSHLRTQRKYRDGRFRKGERQALLKEAITDLSDVGEFGDLSNADRARLPGEVLAALNRSRRKRRRALHR